jgi:hypothetical protein
MVSMEVFLWAIAGGLLVASLSAIAVVYNKEVISTKHLSRDFILGTILTGCIYPLIPETLQEISTAVSEKASSVYLSPRLSDPGVQVGPPNF